MSGLISINILSAKINVSSRTLRHWEDMGLFKSTRDLQSGWRMYDEEAVNCIRITDLLRRLDLSIEDIKKILENKSVDELINALKKQLNKLEKMSDDLSKRRIAISEIIKIIQNTGDAVSVEDIVNLLIPVSVDRTKKQMINNRNNRDNKEIVDMSIFNLNYDYEYIIVALAPMRTAAVHHYGLEPEDPSPTDTWIKENNLLGTARFFGFNTDPYPTEENPEFGYDFCVSIPENVDIPDYLYEKRLPGGIYAAFTNEDVGMGELWSKIHRGLANPEWEWEFDTTREPLEEHIGIGIEGSKLKITVLIPVKKRM